jgi:pimeloyl-ACP methyl ester carboxylesterase
LFGNRQRNRLKSGDSYLTGGLEHTVVKRDTSFCLLILFTLTSTTISADDRFETEDVSFVANFDQTNQRYVRMLPRALDTSAMHHVLIALHGHGSDRWQFSSGTTSTGRAARNAAVQRSMILILPDYRAKTSWMGPAAEADVCQIIDEVRQEYNVGKVVICGGSMGASSALTFAALHPDLVAGVAAMNGTANHLEYERFQPAITASFGGIKQDIPEEYKKRSAEYWPERLTMPIGVTVSGNDTVVPPDSVRRLIGILQLLKRPVLIIDRPDVGHTSRPEDAQEVLNFVLDRALASDDEPQK